MARLVGQGEFFPGDRRLRELDLLGNGLPLLNRLIPWEHFRPILRVYRRRSPKDRVAESPMTGCCSSK